MAVAGLLAGCGSGGSSGTDGAGKEFRDDKNQYYDAAVEEGEVTWYTAHYNTETAELVKSLFEEAYPEVKVNLYRQTAQRILQRYSQETENGSPSADLLGITETGLVHTLAEEGQLQEFVPELETPRIEDYAKYDDPNGMYHVAGVGSNIIAINTSIVSEDEAPKSWSDLLDPKWNGKIATGHPGASGYVGTWATQMYLTYGDEYFVDLQAQDVLVGQSVTDTTPRVATGERPIGVSSEQTTAQSIDDGSPIKIIYPEDGAVIMPVPNAIPAAAEHPNAGKLLAEFILDPEVQEYLAGENIMPIIEGIDPPEQLKDAAGQKYIRPELADLESQLSTVIARWQELFGA